MSPTIQLEIRRPGKEPGVYAIEPGVYAIGRDEDCHLRLSHERIEGRHAILTVREDGFWIEDLDSTEGTFVDRIRVSGRQPVVAGQMIGIGPFTLVLTMADGETFKQQSTPEPAQTSPIRIEEIEQRRKIKQQIHSELVERLDIKRLAATRVHQDELKQRALQTLRDIIRDRSDMLPPEMDRDALAKEIYDEALGLGPLEDFLADPDVTEIMVNGYNQVYVEKKGRLIPVNKTFLDNDSVLAIIERIVSPIGRRIDESQPYVDARLPDGSRVNAIIPPLSLVGPCLTIRKFSKVPYTDKDLIRFGTMTPAIAEFARLCVLMRKNIVISGGTGSGKTTLLNVLSSYLPENERIITIEDAAELKLEQTHVVRLEARPPNIEGRGAITIRDLVRNALRMRPDRIVVGECRGGEALDMLQAMNTGHDGSLTTVHANSPRDVISRLETMVLMSGMDLPVRAIREQIASAIDLIIHESRLSDGSRRIVKITEVVGLEGDQITMQDIFEFRQTGVAADGRVLGVFMPTGAVPTFIEDVATRGLSIDRRIFDPMSSQQGAGKC